MKFIFFMFVYFSFPYCFAQINPMEYFYKGRCEESIPDFAALAVLEKQHCPYPINHEKQICTSRYRILRVLDAAFDTLRKEYLEVKEKPVSPCFRYRPMLIFGKYKNGMLQIEEYEETREYFDFHSYSKPHSIGQSTEFLSISTESSEIYAFHSIGTPYYNAKSLDSIDMFFYNKYIIPYFKYHVEGAGKNFGELLLRLTYNRTPIKAAKIRNDFAALVVIDNMQPANNFKQDDVHELSMVIETIFKNDTKIGPKTAIFIDGERLPPSWGCLPSWRDLSGWNNSNFLERQPFYLLGNLKNGNLVVESLISTRDAFVFGDTIYDISMGFPFEELITYFLPSNISLKEFKFGRCLGYAGNVGYILTKDGIIRKHLASQPDSLKKIITEIAMRHRNFLDNKSKLQTEIKIEWPYVGMFPMPSPNTFRCRSPDEHHPPIIEVDSIVENDKGISIFTSDPYYANTEGDLCVCRRPFASKDYGVWGRKW